MSSNAVRISKRDRKRQELLYAMEGRLNDIKHPEPASSNEKEYPDPRESNWDAHHLNRSIFT